MARQFLTGLNLNKNELLNAKIQNLPTSQAPSSPTAGQIFFDTDLHQLKVWDGTAWLALAAGGNVAEAIAAAIDLLTTDDIEEGSSNLYYTTSRAKTDAAALLTSASLTNITITGNGSGLTITAENGVADSTTDDLDEGTTNLYFTDSRAVTAAETAATSANTANKIVKRDGSGNFAAGQITANEIVVQAAGQIYEDSNLIIQSNTGYPIQIVGNQNVEISSQNGDIVLSPDGNVHANSSITATSNVEAAVLLAGGTANGNDGTLYVQKADGSNVLSANATSAVVDINGTLQVGPSYTSIEISGDGSGNGVIYAPNNNLLLQSDNGNSGVYLGTVDNDNRVVTQGGSQTLSNKAIGTGTYLAADLDADGFKITGLGTPTNPGDAATKAYVDNATAGLTWKNAVNLLWDDANAGLTGDTGTLVIDGHAALGTSNVGYRILITSGTNAGLWVYADDGDIWTLSRSSDADAFAELKGATVFVEEGETYGQSAWTQANHYITDFTGQDWVQFSGASQITAGAGLTKTGNQLDVVGTADRITANANSIDIASTYEGQSSIVTVGTITTGTWNGTTIAVEDGGTGATTAAGARSNLGATTKYAVNNSALTATGGQVSWVVTHNLGTEDVIVQLKDISSKELVEVDVDITSTNTVTLSWVSGNVVDDAFRVVVIG
jgi:hypothetical protein